MIVENSYHENIFLYFLSTYFNHLKKIMQIKKKSAKLIFGFSRKFSYKTGPWLCSGSARSLETNVYYLFGLMKNMQKFENGPFENLFPQEPQGLKKLRFLYSAYSSLFKSWSPGIRRGHYRENHFLIPLFKLEKNLLEPAGQFKSNLIQI
jgi:hypothetical protein